MLSPNVVGVASVIVSSAVGFLQTLPHTFYLDNYYSIFQMYRSGFAVSLPQELLDLAEEVTKDCNLTVYQAKTTKFFAAFGFDAISAGSTAMSHGARIGIPYNFTYKKADDVEVSLLKIGKEAQSLDVTTSQGKKLLNSLVLSEEAKRFAVAREVYSTSTSRPLVCSFGTALCMLLGYAFGANIRILFNFNKRLPLAFRVGFYLVNGSFAALMCCMTNDAVNTFYDSRADDKAALVGEAYARGGVEYYEKLLARNKALRKLLGDDGPRYYTPSGNLHTWIRYCTTPPSARLDNLRIRLKEYKDTIKEEKQLS